MVSRVRLLAFLSIAHGIMSCAGEKKEQKPARPAQPPTPQAPVEEPAEEPAVEVAKPEEAPAEPADERDLLERVDERARASYERGVELVASEPDAALAAFQAAARKSPEFYVAHFNAGALLQRRGDREAAKEAYERALATKPGYAPAVVGVASLLLERGDVAGAEAFLRRHARPEADAVPVRAALAGVLVRRGQLEPAREMAIGVLRQDERNARAMLAMGMLYRRKKMFELSTLALNQAIEIDPGLGEAYGELGLVLVAQDDKAKAVAAFERAAAATPHIAAVLNNLGAMRNEVGAFQGAIEVLERAVALEPERATYYLNLGNAYRGEQRYADAETAYKKALEAGGGTPEALFNLGVLYLDNEIEGKDTVARLRECVGFLKSYQSKVAVSRRDLERITEYLATAEKGIEREIKHKEREEKRARQRAEREAKEAAEAGTPEEATTAAEPTPGDPPEKSR